MTEHPAGRPRYYRRITPDRLLAIRIVARVCGWRELHTAAIAAAKGDRTAMRRMRIMLGYPVEIL